MISYLDFFGGNKKKPNDYYHHQIQTNVKKGDVKSKLLYAMILSEKRNLDDEKEAVKIFSISILRKKSADLGNSIIEVFHYLKFAADYGHYMFQLDNALALLNASDNISNKKEAVIYLKNLLIKEI